MNLNEKLAEAEKVLKANAKAKAKAEADEKERFQQKAKQDELMSRVVPAAEALKGFIEGADGLAIIRFLRETDGRIDLGSRQPKAKIKLLLDLLELLSIFIPKYNLGKYHLVENYWLTGEGFLVNAEWKSGPDNWQSTRSKNKTRRARWDDYWNLCQCHALRKEDPFSVIELIKTEASTMADRLLNPTSGGSKWFVSDEKFSTTI